MEERSEWTNYRGISLLSLPRRVYAKMPRKKLNHAKLYDTQCGFRRGRSTTEQISTLQLIFDKSWENAKDVYTCSVDLGKVLYMAGFVVKSFGCVAGVRCWRVPLAGCQVTAFLLRRLCPCQRSSITIVQRWCWTPTMVCVVTTPLDSLYQGSPNDGPRVKSYQRSHFHPVAKRILAIMKKHYIYEKLAH